MKAKLKPSGVELAISPNLNVMAGDNHDDVISEASNMSSAHSRSYSRSGSVLGSFR